MNNSKKSNALLNAVTVLAFGSLLVISVQAFAADVGVGVGGAVNRSGGGVGIGGTLDRGTGSVGVGASGAVDRNSVDANGGVIATPPETRGSINTDGSVSVDRDRAKQRAADVRRKARDTTRDTTSDATRDTHLPKPKIGGSAGGEIDTGN